MTKQQLKDLIEAYIKYIEVSETKDVCLCEWHTVPGPNGRTLKRIKDTHEECPAHTGMGLIIGFLGRVHQELGWTELPLAWWFNDDTIVNIAKVNDEIVREAIGTLETIPLKTIESKSDNIIYPLKANTTYTIDPSGIKEQND